MQPFYDADLDTVRSMTASMPLCHGAPVHQGHPACLGIGDLVLADWGDPVLPETGETALFRPCGPSALAGLKSVDLPFFISHVPGAMLVTDLKESILP